MKRERVTYWIVIAVLILIILLLRTCNGSKNPCPELVSKTVVHDTIKGEDIISYVPQPYEVIKYIQAPVKTESINGTSEDYKIKESEEVKLPVAMKDPVTIRKYSDTLRFIKGVDTLGLAIVKDSVEGIILSRSFSYSIFSKTITNNLVVKARNKFFIGGEAIGNQNKFIQYIGGNAALQLKRTDNIISVGAGLMNGQIFYKAGYQVKIHF